ncbi:MAG: oligosaccharide flippase family protein, partial [Opitutaceae bacterium]
MIDSKRYRALSGMITNTVLDLFDRTIPNQFIRNVVILSGTTIVAQGLTVLASPIISRLYTPGELGILSIFMSLVNMAWVFSSGRYESAVSFTRKDDDAFHIVVLSMIILTASSFAFFVALLVWGSGLISLLGLEPLRPYILLIPFGIIGLGAYQIGSYWPIRKRTYGLFARTKVWQSIGQVLVQIIGGLMKAGAVGLIVGDIVGRSSGSFSLFKRIWHDKRTSGIILSPRTLARLAWRYRRFPLFSTWSSFLLTIASSGVPLILGKYYGLPVLGFVGLV